MPGVPMRRPGAGHVGQFGVDAFHRQAHSAAAGQHDLDHAAGIFAAVGREVDRQDRHHGLARAQLDVLGLHFQHAVEMQPGADAASCRPSSHCSRFTTAAKRRFLGSQVYSSA